MPTNFEPNEWVIFVQSTKIGTFKNKAIHSNRLLPCFTVILTFFILFIGFNS